MATLFTRVRPVKGLHLRFTNDADARAYSPMKGQGLDNSRLQALGWRPLVDLPTGLERMVTVMEASQPA